MAQVQDTTKVGTPLNVNDFRLPEESDYLRKIKSHPGLKKWAKYKKRILAILQTEPGLTTSLSYRDYLLRNGVRITKSLNQNVIEAVDHCLRMVGSEIRFEAFAIKELGGDSVFENAMVIVQDEGPIIAFYNDILNSLNQDEIRPIIGHEIGHYLLGHVDLPSSRELPSVECLNESNIKKAEEEKIFNSQHDLEDVRGLCSYLHVLSQIRELSADRIGLLASQRLDSSISAFIKLTGGKIGESVVIDDYISQGKEIALDYDEDVVKTHPYGPKRSWALQLFYESDLYNRAVGKEGGNPISKFSIILPQIVPVETGEKVKRPISTVEELSPSIDDYLLDVFFSTMVALSDGKETTSESSTISSFVPNKIQGEIKTKWDELNKRIDSEPFDKVYGELCLAAKDKEEKWKARLVKKMIKVAKADRKLYEEELSKIAEISKKIEAKKECSREFRKEFGYDPFAK